PRSPASPKHQQRTHPGSFTKILNHLSSEYAGVGQNALQRGRLRREADSSQAATSFHALPLIVNESINSFGKRPLSSRANHKERLNIDPDARPDAHHLRP